jgi:hypothetical protein
MCRRTSAPRIDKHAEKDAANGAHLLLADPAARFAVFASIKSTRGRMYELLCIVVVFVLNTAL